MNLRAVIISEAVEQLRPDAIPDASKDSAEQKNYDQTYLPKSDEQIILNVPVTFVPSWFRHCWLGVCGISPPKITL